MNRLSSSKRPCIFAIYGLVSTVVMFGTASGQPGPARQPPNPVRHPLLVARQTFYDAVENKQLIDVGVERFERLAESDPDLAVRASAYLGSLKGLRAKHAIFPLSKIIWVRRALRQLDAARADAPDDLEVAFLRGVICHHLPFFYGRRGDAVADFRYIIDRLPDSHTRYDIRILNDIFNVVIEKSRLRPEEISEAVRLREELNYPKLPAKRHELLAQPRTN